MFTGLIEGVGIMQKLERHGVDSRVVIRTESPMGSFVLGESIAVSGACLTVASFQGDVFTVDASAETLQRTTLGRKRIGARLNLERALRLGDRLGGHLVSGHVDGIGVLKDRYQEGRSWRLVFGAPPEIMRGVIGKGSITVDGVSLTVNGCDDSGFDVNIIPHTATATTLDGLKTGEEVNLETDLVGKYIERLMGAWMKSPESREAGGKVTEELLRKHGCIS